MAEAGGGGGGHSEELCHSLQSGGAVPGRGEHVLIQDGCRPVPAAAERLHEARPC